MVIRPIEPGDWPAFFPVFRDIVEAGETYAYPLGLTPEQAWDLWVEGPPGVTVVAVDESGAVLGSAKWVLTWAHEQGYAAMQFNAVVETNEAAVTLWKDLGFQVIGTVPEAFESRTHGRVGLHVMHRYL